VNRRRGGIVAVAVCLGASLLALPRGTAAQSATPVFGAATLLPASDGGTEPRVAITPDGRRWVITNQAGTAVVYVSADGVHWTQTAGNPAGQVVPSIDVDIVATRTGRLIATELDFSGPSNITSYSDDGGATWTQSTLRGVPGTNGTHYADQDRPWLAVGPDDATTGQPRVYMLFHNLASGAATHNMYVSTSTDGGASFGPPIPITLPGSQAWLDLQCADSGGPSNLVVNQKTGQVYAVFGTRSSAAGGCGASVTGSFEINVVAATRVWVATATPDGATQPTWTQSMAVDDNATGQIVGMQLAPGALDSAGNIYVAYPESPNAYPDYGGASIRYVHAPADLSSWSQPVTVAPSGGAGHLLPHLVAGAPGQIDFAYFTGVAQSGDKHPLWYMTAAQTLDGNSATPHIVEHRLSDIATYQWTASEMMGACGSGPTAGVQNGFQCNRSTDVWGIALDNQCHLVVSWPVQHTGGGSTPDVARTQGTYVAVQSGGSTVCAAAAPAVSPAAAPSTPSAAPSGQAPAVTTSPAVNLPNTTAAAGAAGAAGIAVLLVATGLRTRRRGGPR
jgi:BNR repeat-like domain